MPLGVAPGAAGAGAAGPAAPEAAALRAACDALAAELRARAAGPVPSAEERSALKGEIVAVIRAAAAAARAFAALEADARGLAALWKALPQPAERPVAADAPAGADGSPVAAEGVDGRVARGPHGGDDVPSRESRAGGHPGPPASAGHGDAPSASPDAVPNATPHPAPNAPAAPAPAGAPRRPRRTTRADHLGASTYAARGWTAYAAGDYAAAESAYAQAAALAPDDAESAALHGWALAALGRDDDALLAAHRVLTAAPPPPAGAAALARVALGRVCLHKGITGEALEHLARVTRDDADRRATLYATFHLGVAYGRRGMHDSAVTFLRRALALGPNLVEAHYELGRAHWQAGAPEAAHEAWRAGAGAGKFNPWAARCEELRLHMAGGGALPAA